MDTKPYFLEAHYYSGGLRHHAYHPGEGRPEWAPAPDAVGFADEFELDGDHSAVELRRIKIDDHELTWLAIYFRSVDEKLGDRKNHAGVGVWLCDLVPTDVQSLLYGLSQLASHIAENIDPEALDQPAREFQTDAFLPHYVAPAAAFPGLNGMPAASGQIVETQLYYAKCEAGVGKCKLLSDFLTTKLLLGDGAAEASRVLVMAGLADKPGSDPQRFNIISDELNAAAKLANAIPAASKAALASADALASDLAEARAQLRQNDADLKEAATLKATYEKFSKDPLAIVLDRIERLSDEVHGLASRAPQQPSYPPPIQPTFPPVRPPRPAPQTVETTESSEWSLPFMIGLCLAFILIAVMVVLVIEKLW